MDRDKQYKNLRNKIKDFTNYGYILLVLSVFLYIGVLIPEERSPYQIYIMMGSTFILLCLAFTFFLLVTKYKKQFEEQ
ncbi:YrhC family protein [Fredinandcohnia sp. QZ13]|uniref:YrhC family protein n=1 Tax=Fredinandcohnia sp. QZ13 TaxID=3073144 RepID=UPI0028534B04|nr:YrhC family protein [Fredinandcohnia sp. QZ13]MDR4889034.1 YrhC family protein [Fredinandcohnia sp. QZ13]